MGGVMSVQDIQFRTATHGLPFTCDQEQERSISPDPFPQWQEPHQHLWLGPDPWHASHDGRFPRHSCQ